MNLSGIELIRIDGITIRYSIRSDGQILRDHGWGWNTWQTTENPVEYATDALAAQARLARDYPAREAYKLALHRAIPMGHWLWVNAKASNPESTSVEEIDRKWRIAHDHDILAPIPSLGQWRALVDLYQAMEVEIAAQLV